MIDHDTGLKDRGTPVRDALQVCDFHAFEQALAHDDLWTVDVFGETVLSHLVRHEKRLGMAWVQVFLRAHDQRGLAWPATFVASSHPMQQAIARGSCAMVQTLQPRFDLNEMLDGLDRGQPTQRTSLMVAILQRRHDLIEVMLPGRDLDRVDGRGRTALMIALEAGDGGWVRALLLGSSMEARDSNDSTPLMVAVQTRPHQQRLDGWSSWLAVVQAIGQRSTTVVNAIDSTGTSALGHAVHMANPDLVQALVHLGATGYSGGGHEGTPLMSAVCDEDAHVALVMVRVLTPVSDPMQRNAQGFTALHHAMEMFKAPAGQTEKPLRREILDVIVQRLSIVQVRQTIPPTILDQLPIWNARQEAAHLQGVAATSTAAGLERPRL